MGKDNNISHDIASDDRQVIDSDYGGAKLDFGGSLDKTGGVDLNSRPRGIDYRNEGEPHSGQRIHDVVPTNIENKQLSDEFYASPENADKEFRAPYPESTEKDPSYVFKGEFDNPNTLSQAHPGETPKENGRWYASPSDVEGLNADEIKDKYAIPGEPPTHVSDYNLGEGTDFTVGETQGHEGWGEGGGKQYYTDESENKDLISTRPIPDDDDDDDGGDGGDDLNSGGNIDNTEDGTRESDESDDEHGEDLNSHDSVDVYPPEDEQPPEDAQPTEIEPEAYEAEAEIPEAGAEIPEAEPYIPEAEPDIPEPEPAPEISEPEPAAPDINVSSDASFDD